MQEPNLYLRVARVVRLPRIVAVVEKSDTVNSSPSSLSIEHAERVETVVVLGHTCVRVSTTAGKTGSVDRRAFVFALRVVSEEVRVSIQVR